MRSLSTKTRAIDPPCRPRFPDDGLIGLLALGYILLGSVAAWLHGEGISGFDRGIFFDALFLAVAVLLGLFLLLVLKNLSLGFRGLSAAWDALQENYLRVSTLLRFAALYLLLPLFLHAYHGLKSLIPTLYPFAWDEPLMRLDRWLHFDHHPWELLGHLLGNESIVVFIDGYYTHTWIVVLALFLTGMTWHPSARLRGQFFLSFVACWFVLGWVAALLFSSAGPCFFEPVTGENGPYRPLFAALGHVDAENPLRSLALQKSLWQAHQQGQLLLGTGISAMPSMHLAGATLCTLAARRIHPLLGWILAGHVLLILVGSVLLGWHYAVDGYVGIALTCLIWRLAGRPFAQHRVLP